MAKRLLLPRIETDTREGEQLLEGEFVYDKSKKKLYYGDGSTAGGIPVQQAPDAEQYVYGVDYDTTVATAASACKRVVLDNVYDYEGATPSIRWKEVTAFTQMPAHNFRRCVMDDLANRHVNYYLNASNSDKKADGTPSVLSGADGDVMVEIPVTYYRIDSYTDANSHLHKVYLVCNRPFTNSAPHPAFYVSPDGQTLRNQYIGAYRSIVCDSEGQVVAQTTPSTPAAYSNGRMFRSITGGRASGSFSQGQHRVGAGLNGAQGINSLINQFLMIMMGIDGCTWDTQAGISIGYSNAAAWDYGYVRPNGYTNVLGNETGDILSQDGILVGGVRYIRTKTIDYTTSGAIGWQAGGVNRWTGSAYPAVGDAVFSDNTLTTQVANITEVARDAEIAWNSAALTDTTKRVCAFNYRGIENAYGSQWCFEDGIQKNQTAGVLGIVVSATQYDRNEAGDSGSAFAWKSSGNVIIYTAVINPTSDTAVYSDAAMTTSAGSVATNIPNSTYSGFWMTTATSAYSDTDLGVGPANSPFPVTGYTGATYKWVSQAWPKMSGYVGGFDYQTFFPNALGGSSSTYLGDYFYNNAGLGARVVCRGISLDNGAFVGLGHVRVYYGLTYSYTTIGARLSA